MEGDDDKELLLTAAEIAYLFHESKITIYCLMLGGELPTVRLGKLVKVRLGVLERFVLKNNGLYSKERLNAQSAPN